MILIGTARTPVPLEAKPTLAPLHMALPGHDTPQSRARLLTDADVPATLPGGSFGYSRITAALVAGAMVLGGSVLIAVGRTNDNPFAYYFAALLFVLLWIYHAMVVARFRTTNWLVRVADHGLYIKFRSYLNHHLPPNDPTVVYIPFRDIRMTRIVREVQEVPDADGRGATSRRRTVVELELGEDLPEIARALAVERQVEAPRVAHWYGNSAARYRHYPVQMPTARIIAIEWGVAPKASVFASIMALHTPVESARIVRDFTAIGAMVHHEQESRLLELAENGRAMDAIRLARSLYGFDMTEAKRFIDGLSGRAKA